VCGGGRGGGDHRRPSVDRLPEGSIGLDARPGRWPAVRHRQAGAVHRIGYGGRTGQPALSVVKAALRGLPTGPR
jgi:hypothetical protein